MKLLLISLIFFIVACESKDLDIKFKFYAEKLSDSKTIYYDGDISSVIGTRYFDVNKPSVFITHGYSFYLQSRGSKPLIEAHLEHKDDVNVVYIDWTAYTNRRATLDHAVFMKVALGVYEMLKAVKISSKDFSKVQLLSFGIGAHLFGYVARHFQKNEDFKFSRLTCLDPSGENFEKIYGFWIPELVNVDEYCAEFVDVIHTNGGSIGDETACGHVDFYFNNGVKQPLCTNEWKLAYFALFDVQMFIGCDHQFSWIVYIESMKRKLSSPGFIAKKCERCFVKEEGMNFRDECKEETSISAGYYARATVDHESMYGCYHVTTNAVEPYSKN